MSKLLTAIAFLVFISCNNNNKKVPPITTGPVDTSSIKQPVQKDTSERTVVNEEVQWPPRRHCDKAIFAGVYKSKALYVIDTAFMYMIRSINDSCVLAFVDFVFEKCEANMSVRNLSILDTITCHFDGYISEYVIDLLPRLISKNPDVFFSALYANRKKWPCLVRTVNWYVSIYDGNDTIKDFMQEIIDRKGNKAFTRFMRSLEE